MIMRKQISKSIYASCYRNMIINLLKYYNEEKTVYVYVNQKNGTIKYIDIYKDKGYLFDSKYIKPVESTLKDLFIYLMIKSYNELPLENIVIYSNRILKGLTVIEAARALNITVEKYTKLEQGYISKINYSEVSEALNFNKNEFTKNYDLFKKTKSIGVYE